MVTTTTTPLDQAVLGQLEEDVGPELIAEILEVFATDAERLVGELRAAAQKGDLKATGALAHTLKGTCATVGANDLSAIARRLESVAASGDQMQVDALVEAIGDDLGAVLAAVHAVCAARA